MQEIADVYARSLFQVAKEHDVLDEVHEGLGEFADALAGNRDLEIYFFSPYFSSQEKREGIRKVIEDGEEHFVRFLELLAENHRLPVIFRIRRAFDDLWSEERKLLNVEITSAVELHPNTVRSIGNRIGKETGREVEVTAKVDSDLLGGVVIRAGNVVMDASVRSRLERLRREVAKAA
jgi:F-type H+-transporting ATPase subunit delta